MTKIKEKSRFFPIDIGIDVHKEKWVLSIYEDQKKKETYSMSADGDQLVSRLKNKYRVEDITCVYEAGFSGFWLQRLLTNSGIKCLVVNPADIPTTDYERKRKTDKLDSQKLGLQLSLGNLSGIYIPSKEQEGIRSLVRTRITLGKEKRRQMNRIRSYLNLNGFKAPVHLKTKIWSNAGKCWLKEQNDDYNTLGLLLESYEANRAIELKAAKKIRQVIKQSSYGKIYDCLISIPGIGWATTAVLIGELGDMKRFNHIDKLAGFCGVVPDIRSSADRHYTMGITKRANKKMRNTLIESSWIAIRYDEHLKKVYHQAIAEGKPAQKAIVKVARKLLAKIRAVWLKEEKYKTHIT